MEDIKLTAANIEQWKMLLDEEMLSEYGIENFSATQEDEEWLAEYEGQIIDDAIDDEVQSWP